MSKFRRRPGTYLLIPVVAAVVGWFTNYLAVQMLFYPIKFCGIPLIVRKEQPLGLLGWQGIVPCKTRIMGASMVDMVTRELLSVKQVFGRLSPHRVADLLVPEVPALVTSIVQDVTVTVTNKSKSHNQWLSKWLVGLPTAVVQGLPSSQKQTLQHLTRNFVVDLTRDMQRNIDSILSVKNCVLEQLLADRTLLGKVFRTCGRKELQFLTDSGLWFGFLLGLIQMAVALVWENPWSLSIGGLIVGLATNWLALKWIFEPVNPTQIGPFLLQGQFMKRQLEVSREFGTFYTQTLLTSDKLWHSILTDPETSPRFAKMLHTHVSTLVRRAGRGVFGILPEPEVVALVTTQIRDKLPRHLHVLHPYVDKTLNLEQTLCRSMERMSSAKFERVLHPIFEQDELTLVLAGAVLGFLAGLVQQGLETGAIAFARPRPLQYIRTLSTRLRTSTRNVRHRLYQLRIRRLRPQNNTPTPTANGNSPRNRTST